MTSDPLATPLRIAFAGDWHMNTPWAVHAIKYALRHYVDAIIHVGDFGYSFDDSYLAAIDDELENPYWEGTDVPLLFVDGNHENFNKLYQYPVLPNGVRKISRSVYHLPRGFRWKWYDTQYLALGGAHSVDRRWRTPHLSWWPEETISQREAREVIAAGTTDVLITHDCPTGVPALDQRLAPNEFGFPLDEINRAEAHRKLLRLVVEETQPKVIWHGHYHWRYQDTGRFDYGTATVNGLDCDGKSMEDNMVIFNAMEGV